MTSRSAPFPSFLLLCTSPYLPLFDFLRAQRASRFFHSSLRSPYIVRLIAAREGFPVFPIDDRQLDAPRLPLASHLSRVAQLLAVVQRRVLRGHAAPPLLRYLWWVLLLSDDRGVEELVASQPPSLPPPSQWPCRGHPYTHHVGGVILPLTLLLSEEFATGPFLMQPHGEWGTEVAPQSRLKGWEVMAARSRRLHWFAGREEATQCGGCPMAEGSSPFPRLIGFYSGQLYLTTDRWSRPMLEEAREQPLQSPASWERLPVVEWRSQHGGGAFAYCCLRCYLRLTLPQVTHSWLDAHERLSGVPPHKPSPLFCDPETAEMSPHGLYLHLPSRRPTVYLLTDEE